MDPRPVTFPPPAVPSRRRAAADAARAALRGELPDRYVPEFWRSVYDEVAGSALEPGQTILDVGSGPAPTVPRERRPPDCTYVGFDILAEELAGAPEGGYDETVVGDIRRPQPELEGRFDLVLSYMVLEHVRPIDAALETMRACLRPGGWLVLQLAGGRSLFALANRVIPQPIAIWGLERFLHRKPGTVFPATYDRCTASELERVLAPWSSARVDPLFTAAGYLGPLPALQALYILGEERLWLADKRDWAAYYIVTAQR